MQSFLWQTGTFPQPQQFQWLLPEEEDDQEQNNKEEEVQEETERNKEEELVKLKEPGNMEENDNPEVPRGDVIVEADWCIGQLYKTLAKNKLLDNTLIIGHYSLSKIRCLDQLKNEYFFPILRL